MAAPKGHPKWGGKQKGNKHAKTIAEEACRKLGVNPFEMLCQIALSGDSEQTRLSAIIQLCKHIEPPKKPLEVALDPENSTIRIIVEEYSQK